MTEEDLRWVESLADAGLFRGPVLELGAGWGGADCRAVMERRAIAYVGTNMTAGVGVDLVADFESGDGLEHVRAQGPFTEVLVLNVLEHTFDPFAVMDNVVKLTAIGGRIVVIVPAMWPIHNYPSDYWRPLPDWFRKYGETRRLRLMPEHFDYVGVCKVSELRSGTLDRLPHPAHQRPFRKAWGRLVHKLFNTYGRDMWGRSHVAIGAVFERQGSTQPAS